jgi:outer membrane receptor protein involved in Fe transport
MNSPSAAQPSFIHPARITRRTAALLVAPLLAISAWAQTTTPNPAPAAAATPAQDEVIELSPFVVGSERDRGYVATSSLAGTRIRTELKDIANPISVVTREFMQDVGATDPVDILVYTANTEAGGVGGNYSGANVGSPAIFTDVTRNPQNNNRVRGLARADLTRDYFPSTIVFDGYNTSRVEINRGPNATLFGLGSPGGIINSQLIQPTLKNLATVELSLDDQGSTRATLDVDRVLIPNRLGVRVAGLEEREQFRQKFAYERDRRIFASVHVSPFKDGVLRASFEKGSIDANRPRSDAPRDNLTRWWSAPFNKITHSPGTDEFNTIDRDLLRAPGEWFEQPAVVYESNDATAPARMMYAWNLLVGVPRTPGGNPATGFQANIVSITKGDQWFPSATARALGIQHGSFYADDAINDLSVFNWREQLLDGPNKREWEDFHVGNISYDHNWKHPLGSIGVEGAYSHEVMERSFFDMFPGSRGYQINIDLNTTLPWGAANPNFGRPFIASNNTRNSNKATRESERLTAYLELDFARNTERLKWLGRHNITGYLNRYDLDEESFSGGNSADLAWTLATRAFVNPASARDDINSTDGLVRTAVYIGPSLANLSSPGGINLQGIQSQLRPTTATGWHWDRNAGQFVQRAVQITNVMDEETFKRTTTGGSLSRQVIDSQAFVYQVRPLKQEWLVATIGWRNDRVKDYRNNGGQNVRDDFNFIDRHHSEFRLPAQPGSIFEESIWSRGFVVHKPPFLRFPRGVDFSFHYSKSQNFQPADARIDIYGNSIQPPGGTSEDRGFSLSFLEGKLQTRFNWYETASSRASLGLENTLIDVDARIIRYNNAAALAAAGWQGPSQIVKDLVNWREVQTPSEVSGVNVSFQRPGNMSDTQSTESKGFEFESTFNPTNNWRIAVNVSQQKASRADIAPVTRKYVAERLAEWTTGRTGELLSDESGQPLRTRVYERLLNGVNATAAREGQNVSELREWRWNAITNYTFSRTSRLSGWNVGGAVRWQDNVGIGYPIIDADVEGRTLELPDLANPYMGPSDLKFDAWVGYGRKLWKEKVRWSIQLNVRDVLNEDELVPVMAQPDGSIAAWIAPQGRLFTLRSTFEF